jgi:hypothetical protein
MYRADVYSEKQLLGFIQDNLNRVIDLCDAWGLDILSIEDLKQAGEYLLNQI